MNKKMWKFVIVIYILLVLSIFLFSKEKKENLPVVPKPENQVPSGTEDNKAVLDNNTSSIQQIEREPYQEGPLAM